MRANALIKAERALDHLILGIADLSQGIEWLQEKTGVRAIPGGSHPGAGTRNALVSLENRRYLEIMSIDPDQAQANWLACRIRDLEAPRLITWAAATPDINSILKSAEESGYQVEGPSEGSRLKPGGGKLEWKILSILSKLGPVIPFFIQWGSGIVHPSADSPSGCRLEALVIHHPEAETVREMLAMLGIAAKVQSGPEPQIKAVLATPKGTVHIA